MTLNRVSKIICTVKDNQHAERVCILLAIAIYDFCYTLYFQYII